MCSFQEKILSWPPALPQCFLSVHPSSEGQQFLLLAAFLPRKGWDLFGTNTGNSALAMENLQGSVGSVGSVCRDFGWQ